MNSSYSAEKTVQLVKSGIYKDSSQPLSISCQGNSDNSSCYHNAGRNNDITNLVYVDDNKPVTTSELIAKFFDKRHSDVLRDIKNLLNQIDSNIFTERNFAFCYKNNDLQNGKPNPLYTITRDGFILLCMGYTGKKAMQIKLAYIEAFNAMYELLINQQYSLQAKFNEADYKYLLATEYASEAGKALNHLGKKVKPACKAERDQLFNELQIALDFNSKGVDDDNS